MKPFLKVKAPVCSALLLCLIATSVPAEAQFFDFFRPREQRVRHQVPQYPDDQLFDENGNPVYNEAAPQAPKEAGAIGEFRSQRPVHFPIVIRKNQWSQDDEANFQKFVVRIGKAIRNRECGTVKACMRDPKINPYASTDPKGLVLYSDCADWPYFLRSYFATKNGLPFSYVTGTEINKVPAASTADREDDMAKARTDNSPYGNLITSRGGSNVPKRPGEEKNYVHYLETLLDVISTRSLRVGPLSPTAELSDLYPVAMTRAGISAGTVIHSTGHAGIVFEVDASGTIHWCDAHPDGSVSYKIIKPSTLDRSRPDQGLGFFKFRNQKLVNAQSINGALYGGKIMLETNQELIASGRYSLEQYYGLGSNVLPGQQINPIQFRSAFSKLNFFDSLKFRLREKNNMASADAEITELTGALCTEIKQRVADVDKAIENGGPSKQHPDVMPQNIYSTSGFWEDYSSPGRDSRIRFSVMDIAKTSVSKFKQAKAGGLGIQFAGTAEDYQKVMLNIISKLNTSCQITYRKSDGSNKTLTFSQVINRLNKISFDPYHCPERRWGASGQELATCSDQDFDGAWYNAELGIRNTVGKLNDQEQLIIRSDRDITLSMLQDPGLKDRPEESQINLGTTKLPLMNLEAFFSSAEFLNLLKKP